jgi:hypothetical protein
LVELFGLSKFERALLLTCAAVELDASFAEDWGIPTFGTALDKLPHAHWSALAPSAPLRHWRLLELDEDRLTAAPLRIDERILHYLLGLHYLDGRLEGVVDPWVGVVDQLPSSHEAVAAAVTATWQCSASEPPLIALLGPDTAAKPAIAASACERLGLGLCTLSARAIPELHVERETLRRLWTREAMMTGSGLLLDCYDTVADGDQAPIVSLLEQLAVPTMISSVEPLRLLKRRALRFSVERPTMAEQRASWELALGGEAAAMNGMLDELVEQFDLGLHTIEAAALQATSDGRGPAADRIWAACRAQARPRLDDLAERVESRAGWDDLVLPELQRELLRAIAAHVGHRVHVHERWGFAAKSRRGLAISTLFVGGSGTGKTMAAEVLAGELRLDLYRVDLSAVVSKYIGETEKNLRRVFDAAQEGGVILLFDEADALFGKRTEVKDSHDRHANIEVSYLLQRMESYRGLAILTTNFRSALDEAFLRRLRFVVEFPFPDAAQREEIWRRVFPPQTPTAGLDMSRLARLNIPGGNVRNIALNAAFFAAEARSEVGMSHVLRAARNEYVKLGKPLAGSEIGGWS